MSQKKPKPLTEPERKEFVEFCCEIFYDSPHACDDEVASWFLKILEKIKEAPIPGEK